MPLNLNHPQAEFIAATEPFSGFVGGYRSGKTFIGCVKLWMLAAGHPGIKLGYFAPTYPQIRDIFYDTIEEVAEQFSAHAGKPCTVDINKSEHAVKLIIGGDVYATVKCRSMEHPSRIVGFDISHALIDEIDCMKKEKADAAWKKIVARMSSVRDDYKINTVDFTTTPEGFNWMYDFFVKQLKEKPELKKFYSLTKASTLKNKKNLPDDYIDKLYATYPSNLVDAYVNGDFVNLTSGGVYTCYDRKLNNTDRVIRPNDHLHIGMDFNVGKMSAIVHVKDGRIASAVDEIMGVLDTPSMILAIQSKFPDHRVTIYPDASGDSRKPVDASKTDLSQLRKCFRVVAPKKNPPVKDRVASVQALLCNGNDERRYFVNESKCPETCDSLEQQVYDKNGAPDKAHDNDHPNDALGYFIHNQYPVIVTRSSFTRMRM
ncbi:MAG: terminase [Colwellia sp.]|nr:terminase [Colwellia sp.]